MTRYAGAPFVKSGTTFTPTEDIGQRLAYTNPPRWATRWLQADRRRERRHRFYDEYGAEQSEQRPGGETVTNSGEMGVPWGLTWDPQGSSLNAPASLWFNIDSEPRASETSANESTWWTVTATS